MPRQFCAYGGYRPSDQPTAHTLSYRQVIVLALEGMRYAEIGQTLDIGIAKVGIRLNRAKSMLRTGLAHE